MSIQLAEHVAISGNWESKVANIQSRENLSFQIFVKGAHDLTGNFSFQVSNFNGDAESFEKVPFKSGEDTVFDVPVAGETNFNAIVAFVEFSESCKAVFEWTSGSADDVSIRLGTKE